MKQKKKSKAWFIKVRGSYLPNSPAGWLTYIPYVAYLLAVLWYVVSRQYDLAMSLLILVPNWVAAVAVMHFIAARTSK